jgi:hypothetical protein
MSHDKGR